MKWCLIALSLVVSSSAFAQPSMTTSGEHCITHPICNVLWYHRNAILAKNGYCFRTGSGKKVFGEDVEYQIDCNQDPKLPRQERRVVRDIVKLAKTLKCKVNLNTDEEKEMYEWWQIELEIAGDRSEYLRSLQKSQQRGKR